MYKIKMWFFNKKKRKGVDLESRRSFLKKSLVASSILLPTQQILSDELIFSDETIEKNKKFFIKNENKFNIEIKKIKQATINHLSNPIKNHSSALVFSLSNYIMFKSNYESFELNIESFFKIFRNFKISNENHSVKMHMFERIIKTDLGNTNFLGMYIFPDRTILLRQNNNLKTSSSLWSSLFNELGHHFYTIGKKENRIPRDTIEINEFVSDYFSLVFCYYNLSDYSFREFIESIKISQYENYKLSKSILKEVLKELGIIKKGNANYYIDNNVYFEREEQLEIVSRLKVYFDNFII